MTMTRHALFAALAIVAMTAAHASGGAGATSGGTAGAGAKATDGATCEAQADDRRLLGSDRSNFIKTCEKAARKPCTTVAAVADRKVATPAASNALKCTQG